MLRRKIYNKLPSVTQQHDTSVRLRMVNGRSGLYIPVEGEWLKSMGFPLSTPVRIVVFPFSISLSALPFVPFGDVDDESH